jgi:hypothetical protein
MAYGPRYEDPARPLTHWDFLLKEAHWMAKDFGQVCRAAGIAVGLSWTLRALRGPGLLNSRGCHTLQNMCLWECLLHVSTFATTRVALPTGVKPG